MEPVANVSTSIKDTGMADSTKLRTTIILTISLLVAQFVIGMAVNLFSVFPSSNSANSADQTIVQGIIGTGPGLVIHAITGLAILALSGTTVYFSIRTRVSRVMALAALGLASVILALIGGVSFVLSSFENNLDSFLMALGFILAITSYFLEWNSWNNNLIKTTPSSDNSTRK